MQLTDAELRKRTSIIARFRDLSDRLDTLGQEIQEALDALEECRVDEVALRGEIIARTGASELDVMRALVPGEARGPGG